MEHQKKIIEVLSRAVNSKTYGELFEIAKDLEEYIQAVKEEK